MTQISSKNVKILRQERNFFIGSTTRCEKGAKGRSLKLFKHYDAHKRRIWVDDGEKGFQARLRFFSLHLYFTLFTYELLSFSLSQSLSIFIYFHLWTISFFLICLFFSIYTYYTNIYRYTNMSFIIFVYPHPLLKRKKRYCIQTLKKEESLFLSQSLYTVSFFLSLCLLL